MRCFALTKSLHMCKNRSRLPFCHLHRWWLVGALTLVAAFIADWSAVIQIFTQQIEKMQTRFELQRDIAVIKTANRRSVAEWQGNPDPTLGRSDVLTIMLGGRHEKSIEIYHTIKDQRFKEYPATSALADEKLPTEAEYQVVDVDGDGIKEIVVSLRNQIYSLHADKLVSVLVFDPRGKILAKTPYPQALDGLPSEQLSPYSAFQSIGVMYDEISHTSEPITYSNGFELVERNGKYVFVFSWVVDDAGYAQSHLHSVEEFELRDGRLERIQTESKLYISDSWDAPLSGERVQDIAAAKEFLRRNDQPSLEEIIREVNKLVGAQQGRPHKRRKAVEAFPLPPPLPR